MIMSCAHPGPGKLDAHFQTEIATDGSKRFTYILDFKDLPAFQPREINTFSFIFEAYK